MTPLPAFHAAQNAAHALAVYQGVDGAAPPPAPGAAAADFGTLVTNALGDAIATGQAAETETLGAIKGSGDITRVVTAVSRAELALQTTVAIRDRVLQAYQDIIKMSI